MDNLSKARELLVGERTCVLCRGEEVYFTDQRGVRPLLTWLDQGLQGEGFSAADRVVGRATAFLYCLLGVKEVYARVMSTPAMEVLRANNITALCDREVDGIINRRGDGPCPFEAAVLHIREPREALEAIRAQMIRMGIQ